MTGFGRGEARAGMLSVEAEIKSVNHRFLDLSVKLPRVYGQFEPEVRELLAERVPRGRVEILINRISSAGSAVEVIFNRRAFDKLHGIYADALGGAPQKRGKVSGRGLDRRIRLELLARREIVEVVEIPAAMSKERAVLMLAVQRALTQLEQMRRREGRNLERDIRGRLKRLGEIGREVTRRADAQPKKLRDKLVARLSRLSPEISFDPARLAQEAALAADRIDITEELVRYRSHLAQFATILSGAAAGRKLDFLVQEIGRELNTMTSKSQDAAIQHAVVEGKTELERIREQIQNIQ